MPWLEPVTLEGRFLRLTPATRQDMQELVEATAPDTFRLYTSHPPTWDADGFWDWIQTRTPEPFLTVVMRAKTDGRIVGCSTFFDARERDRAGAGEREGEERVDDRGQAIGRARPHGVPGHSPPSPPSGGSSEARKARVSASPATNAHSRPRSSGASSGEGAAPRSVR